ncbi:fatty acid desaturase [Annulohypoxylon maeteangense]|uniref:fatty acid desaturase n=1 Tax=Annulohypoxylon maeteangense TaxID=1927788 RepID=UPI002008CDA9|nr:fatty acid desaturase [Annulohypoxylon maeteangense]KAI0880991.1 fatty acid desaturase [Annulohypoxylon maeteangense]
MAARTYPVLSRRQIEGLIADGRSIFILDQFVFKADPWLQYHPGGDKAILHMVGRDATDEVTALHSPEARQQMNKYRIGRIEGRWTNFLPPIQGGKFRPLSENDDAKDDNGNEECDQNSTESSSLSSSRDASPVFDKAEPVRKRYVGDGLRGPASTSSVSSAEPDDDGMTYLDTITKQKTTLDLEKYPSLDFATQDSIVAKYRDLDQRIRAEDLYKCNYGAYAIEVTRYSILFGLAFLFLHWSWYVPSAVCLGAFWHQLVFTAHDAGHMGITHGFHTDTVIGIIIADFLGGLSLGWWKRNHNVHHIVTNAPEHDPDIEHMPFLAVSHRFFQSMRSTYYDRIMEYDAVAKFMLRIQPYTYYILLLFGRLNLYRLSWDYLIVGRGPRKGPAWWHRWLEITGQIFFWTWYFYGIVYKSIPNNWDRFVFFLVSHMVPMPVHAQICLSHFAMSTSDLGPHESFPQKMLRTTMDVDCPQWLDFFHGGLQFQVIHHLFPRIPRHNLRRTQKLVQDFCNDVGIPYALYGFVDGNRQVVGTLAEVSRQAAILAKCQKVISDSDDPIHGHHH